MRNLITIIKGNTSGFTMMELVVTLALLGVLVSFAIPAYNGVGEEMQGKRNEANMQTVREAFFHYFYRMHQQKGRIAHFPPAPTNEESVMDEEWASTPIDSLLSPQAPKNLFASGELPVNSNGNPFMYKTWNDTIQASGEVFYYIQIEDIDEDSPSFGKSFTYSI